MAYDSSKPANGGSLVSADIRENFRALKEDGIVVAADLVAAKKDPVAETAGLRTLGTGAQQAMPGNATPTPADASVSQAKLKTSSGSVSITETHQDKGLFTKTENLTLPGGEYGFYPQFKQTVSGSLGEFSVPTLSSQFLLSNNIGTTYLTKICLIHPNIQGPETSNDVTVTSYAQQRYVTSSGEVHWVFILRDKTTKDTIAMYQAPDHPCFGNGGKPLLVPHPFGSYDPDKHEIIVINPSHEEVEAMKKLGERGEDEPDKDLLEVIMEEYEIDEDSKPAWPTKAVTVGLPKDYETKKMGEGVQPIKKAIPRPPYIKTKSLRRKA